MVTLILSILLNCSFVFAWSEHHLVTTNALQSVAKAQEKVKVTELALFLKETSYKNLEGLIRAFKLKKQYSFDFKLNEKKGSEIELIKVVATYSDEPDWGMDTELFSPNQYPELWRSEFAMMGGTKGTPSQSFRHMYWPALTSSSPLNTFKLPLGQMNKVMGEAHLRAKLFLTLALEAKKKNHPYWAARFLGNALHYSEDVTNPFHSAQTPTKIFMFMPFLKSKYGSGFKQYVFQVQNIITYYHFAFEDYVSRSMRENMVKDFAENLKADCMTGFIPAKEIDKNVIQLATLANLESANAAKSAIDFFPELTMKFTDFDAKRFMNEEWWKKTIANGQSEGVAKKNYFLIVKKMFCPLGQSIRFYFTTLFPK